MTKSMATVSQQVAEHYERHQQMIEELNERRRIAHKVSINSFLVGLLLITHLVLITEMTIIAFLLMTWPR